MGVFAALIPWAFIFVIWRITKKLGEKAQSSSSGGAQRPAGHVRQHRQSPSAPQAPEVRAEDPFRDRQEAFETRIPEFHSLEFHDEIGQEDPCYDTVNYQTGQAAPSVRAGALPPILGSDAHDLVRGVMWSEILQKKD